MTRDERGLDIQRRETFRSRGLGYEWPPVNPIPHESFTYDPGDKLPELERPRWLVYTTGSALDTSAGYRFYLPRRIQIISARFSMAGAPTSQAEGDLLVNGTSVYGSLKKPVIAIGELYGRLRPVAEQWAKKDDYLQVQLTDTGSGTGPAIFYIQYRRLGKPS